MESLDRSATGRARNRRHRPDHAIESKTADVEHDRAAAGVSVEVTLQPGLLLLLLPTSVRRQWAKS